MAITYFGVASTPTTTGGTNATSPTVVAPPGSMLAGDLVVVTCHNRITNDTHAVSAAGGQSWTKLTTYSDASGLLTTVTWFWCQFNGTWSTSPSFSHGGTNNTCIMVVFRPTNSTNTWAADVAAAAVNFAAPSTPFDVTRTGITTAANAVAIASFSSRDDNTWAKQTAAWTEATTINNMAGSDTGDDVVYKLMPSAGATGDCVSREVTYGGDTGVSYIASFKEINAYVMSCGTGAFTLSGQNAILLKNSKLLTGTGAFTFTGNNATLVHGYSLKAATGIFTFSGQNATLLKFLKLFAATGVFTLAGQNAILVHGYSIRAGTGAFTLSGQNATLLRNRKLFASVGGFTLSGQNATLLKNLKLKGTAGAFVLSGQNATLLHNSKMRAAIGVFVLSGQNATLLKNKKLFGSAGSFTLSGQNANLYYNRVTLAGVGAFVWTGNPATMIYGGGALINYHLLAEPGSFILSGQDATLLSNRKLFANTGSFLLTGYDTTALVNRCLFSETGIFILTGYPIRTAWFIPGAGDRVRASVRNVIRMSRREILKAPERDSIKLRG